MKTRIRQAFSKAASTYSQAATVQKTVVNTLAARIPASVQAKRLLDVGCGTGFAVAALQHRFPAAELISLDFSEAMLRQSLPHTLATPSRICADAEYLPIADKQIDLLWSSLTWQWCDLARVLAEAKRVLREDGVLAFSTLTHHTFHELTNTSMHSLRLLNQGVALEIIHAARLRRVEIHSERLVAHYPNLKSLLQAIKQAGAHEVSGERPRGLLGRKTWQNIEAAYEKNRQAAGLPLTYEVLYVTARK